MMTSAEKVPSFRVAMLVTSSSSPSVAALQVAFPGRAGQTRPEVAPRKRFLLPEACEIRSAW